jgi:hypothetical protein
MSAYLTLATPMLDAECLILALGDVGFHRDLIQVHDQPVPLRGYEGSARAQRAEIVIPRERVGNASNDIGFERTPTGYRAHVSDYDRARHGEHWMARLQTHYQAHHHDKQARLAEAERQRLAEERRRLVESQRDAIHARARALGYRVEETRAGGTVRLALVKRVY